MTLLPAPLSAWFAARGWQPHPHQLALLEAETDSLLIAPTGGGKTLAGFLPSLSALAQQPHEGLHTLYISPLKALASDVGRNLTGPISEMGLPIRTGIRTGDTPAAERRRLRVQPPHILLTTPESLALMLSWPEAAKIFAPLRRVILDEIHALAESKRGDQLMLGLARLKTLAPGLQVTGLSATVDDPAALAAFMGAGNIVTADPGPPPDIALLPTRQPPPWAGQGGRYGVRDVLAAVAGAKTTIIFHNTRAQAELFFQALWEVNDDNLPIALHHGALGREAREKVEAAMAAGALRAVVATGTLDLGLDWGDVDLVIQIGAPRNIKRLVQRIGRAGHRYNTPSTARLLPANRFEVIECIAAIEAAEAGDLDASPRAPGAPDVLIQHILLTACAGPFDADELYREVKSAGPYSGIDRAEFDACLAFAATGGYALRAYDRWQRLKLREGRWSLRDPRTDRGLRMNIGTIVEAEKMKVKRRGRGGGTLGEVEESFAATLRPGDTFLLGGQVLRYDRIRELIMEVTPAPGRDPKIAAFSGQTFASSLELSQRVLALIADPAARARLPAEVRDWLELQEKYSRLPRPGRLLAETFRRGDRWHLVLYGFAGRNAHQTLGLLISHQMEAAGLAPLAFLASDHALLLTSLQEVEDPAPFLSLPALEEGLREWLAQSSLMKRSFRAIATIAGLIQRNAPGARKSGKQATFSSDIIYDTLLRHDPDHVLMQATRREAAHGLIDFDRLREMVENLPGLEVMRLERVSPLAAPLLLELGRVRLGGTGHEQLAEALARELMDAAGLKL